MAVSNYAELEEKTKRYLCAVAMCASLVFLPSGAWSKADYIVDYKENSKEYSHLYKDLNNIPDDATVAASPLFIAHLSDRAEIEEYFYGVEADYIVLDCRDNKYDSRVVRGLEKKGYTITSQIEDYYVILQNAE